MTEKTKEETNANPSTNAVHFRTQNITALCRTFNVGRRLRLSPDPERVTCERCKKLLAERAKAKPMRIAHHVR
jgi:RNase P subunit RPR2